MWHTVYNHSAKKLDQQKYRDEVVEAYVDVWLTIHQDFS